MVTAVNSKLNNAVKCLGGENVETHVEYPEEHKVNQIITLLFAFYTRFYV